MNWSLLSVAQGLCYYFGLFLTIIIIWAIILTLILACSWHSASGKTTHIYISTYVNYFRQWSVPSATLLDSSQPQDTMQLFVATVDENQSQTPVQSTQHLVGYHQRLLHEKLHIVLWLRTIWTRKLKIKMGPVFDSDLHSVPPPSKSGQIFFLSQKMRNFLKRMQKKFSDFFV